MYVELTNEHTRQCCREFSENALIILKKTNIEIQSFITELYQQNVIKTIGNIDFKVIKKTDRYFDIFDLYLLGKTSGDILSDYHEIIKVDFGSGILS